MPKSMIFRFHGSNLSTTTRQTIVETMTNNQKSVYKRFVKIEVEKSSKTGATAETSVFGSLKRSSF